MYIPSAYLMQSSGKDKDVSLPSRLWYLPFPGIQRSSCQSFDDNIMGPPLSFCRRTLSKAESP